MSKLTTDIAESPAGIVVRLTGQVGILEVEPLRGQLSRLVAKRPALVVFDLAGLTFISSLGMGALMEFRRGATRQGGQVKLAAVQPTVLEAFKAAGLDQVFPIAESAEAALAGPAS